MEATMPEFQKHPPSLKSTKSSKRAKAEKALRALLPSVRPKSWTLPDPNHAVSAPPDAETKRLLEYLIDQWSFNAIDLTSPGTILSLGVKPVDHDFERNGFSSQLRKKIQKDRTLLRIDLQKHFDIQFQDGDKVSEQWMANIQGQYGKETFFHVDIAARAVKNNWEFLQWGAEFFKACFRESLLHRKTVVVVTANPWPVPLPTDHPSTYTCEAAQCEAIPYVKYRKL